MVIPEQSEAVPDIREAMRKFYEEIEYRKKNLSYNRYCDFAGMVAADKIRDVSGNYYSVAEECLDQFCDDHTERI